MDAVIWLPGMFILGIVLMALFYWFMSACEKI
jgi:hypothetical protein